MTTVIKVIITAVLALLMTSCNSNFGIRGNGHVISQDRPVDGTFTEIEVSRGLDVYLTQGDHQSITVQADDNLHDVIKTVIEGKVLKIYADENINYSSAQKILISFNSISKITATSGSDVYATNKFNIDRLNLISTSGSDLTLEIDAQTLECIVSSGSNLNVSGTVINFTADASSGSDIDASNLKAEISRVKATSGADIKVNTTQELYANANSGGDIKYQGNPIKVDKTRGVASDIHQD